MTAMRAPPTLATILALVTPGVNPVVNEATPQLSLAVTSKTTVAEGSSQAGRFTIISCEGYTIIGAQLSGWSLTIKVVVAEEVCPAASV